MIPFCRASVPALLTSLVPWLLPAPLLRAQLPAFPGAEGYGSTATGGRGGDVYYVTNRNASGAGSFANGISTAPAAGRTIVFAVSGHIRLPSGSGGGLTLNKNKITVAGQTAPGDGICFWNNTMNLTGDDLVLRHLRWRYGKQAAGGDSVDINGSSRVIIDHCDVMFSTDENLSSFGTAPEHLTFQWSINAWGLSGHSAGGLWKTRHATVHHTLWANNHTRNPKLIGCDVFDWANNVTFGWNNGFNMAQETTGGTGITYRINVRGSSFIHGGSTSDALFGGGSNDDASNKFKLHVADSALDGNNNGLLDVSRSNYAIVSSGSTYDPISSAWPQTTLGNPATPVTGAPVSLTPRLTAWKQILSKAGAVCMETGSRPLRDEITQLCITRTAALQRGIIADPLELALSTGTAFADLQSTPAPADTDLDGMPDEWEEALGYDKTLANNNTVLTAPQTAASFFPPGSPAGYTRLEEYLHFKAVPHGTVAKNTAASPSFIDIDLRKYTSGFTANPVFTLTQIINGTLTQSGPGNALARFTPTAGLSGRAGFHFTVTDAAGSTWTQQCCLLISTKTQPRPITWNGDGLTNLWDTTTANFISPAGPTAFASTDAVTLNDNGSNAPTLKVTGALAPGSLTVSNSTKNFVLQGTGSLAATGPLLKSGSGTLTISNAGPNSFTAATLEGGTLSLTTGNALGSTPLTLTAGTLALSADLANPLLIGGTVALHLTGSRTLNGAWSGEGTINLTHPGTNLLTLGGSMANFSGTLSLGSSTGSVRLFGNTGSAGTAFDLGTSTASLFTRNGGAGFQLGALTGSSGTTLSGASSATTLTTYTVGALGTSTTFAGRITNGGQGTTALTKTGSGSLTLTGNSTHSGPTAINSGSLVLMGTLGASPVTVGTGALLSGTGTMGGSLTTSAGAMLSPGADQGSAPGTLTAASLSLVSPTLRFDLSNNPAAGNDRIAATGSDTLSGTVHFSFTLTHGSLSPGTYDLITTTGPLTATGVTLTSNLPVNSRQNLTLETHSNGVRLIVSGTQANLTWTGANGGLWDQQTTAAWSGALPATFYNADHVSFTDTASNGTVTLTQPVAPQSITIHNSAARPYTFTGAPLTGNASLSKSGNGSLTLNLPRFDLPDCTANASSPVVTVSSTTGLVPGMTVLCRDNPALIPAGTTLVSIGNNTTVTLSQNATASSTTARIIFETRHTFTGGTILNDGTLTLASNSWEYYSSAFPPPSNPFGLGTGPITLNGGTLTLLGHNVSTLHVSGALPNDLIVPAGKTATLRSVMRGTYLNDTAGLRGRLTGAGTLNLVVNYAYSAITGDWSGFSGTLNVSRPASGANDPRFQPGNTLGLPLANVNLDQVTLSCTATPPAEGFVIPLGSLSGTSSTNTIIAGAQAGAAPVTWRIGSLNTSTTFAGNFTPYGNAPIGLEKTGSGTLTLTGSGTVSAGITVESGTLSYGDAATDTLGGTSDITVNSSATLQLNQGAKITGTSCEIFTHGTLRGRGTLQAPLYSSGTLAPAGGTLSLTGNASHHGTLELSSYTDRLAVTGHLDMSGLIQLPAIPPTPGRKLIATCTGTLSVGAIAIQNLPAAWQATPDTSIPGEFALILKEPTPYQAWILTYPGLMNASPTADPDHDGIPNLLEFALNGQPHLPDSSLLPTVSREGNVIRFSFLQRESSHTALTQIIQAGTSPGAWTNYRISPPQAPEISIGPTTAGARRITLTLPASVAPAGRFFGRLAVSLP